MGEDPGPRQAGLWLEQAHGAAAGPTHLTGRPGVQALARPPPVASPAAGTAWAVAPAPTTSTKTQDTTGRPRTARRGRERRGCAAPVNAGGGKQISCCQVESYVYFLGKAWTTSKETLRSSVRTRHRCGCRGQSRLGFGLGLPAAPPRHDPSALGAALARPQEFGFLRLGRGRSTEDGWSEAPAEGGASEAQARGRGAAAPMAGRPPAPSACRRPAPSGGRGKEVAAGAAGVGKQPWQRTTVAPRPEGWAGHRVPPTPLNVGPGSGERMGQPDGQKPCREKR